jgi:hypothetical protein
MAAAGPSDSDLKTVLITRDMVSRFVKEHSLEHFAEKTKLYANLEGEKNCYGIDMALALAIYDYEDNLADLPVITRRQILWMTKEKAALLGETLIQMIE